MKMFGDLELKAETFQEKQMDLEYTILSEITDYQKEKVTSSLLYMESSL